ACSMRSMPIMVCETVWPIQGSSSRRHATTPGSRHGCPRSSRRVCRRRTPGSGRNCCGWRRLAATPEATCNGLRRRLPTITVSCSGRREFRDLCRHLVHSTTLSAVRHQAAPQAAGWVLKEQVRLGETGIGSLDWESYPVLRFTEIPEVDVTLIDPIADRPALGVGEATAGPTAAAIGNAVAHALGARLHDLPLTRERVMAALLSG